AEGYDVRAVAFPFETDGWSAGVHVAAVVAFPRTAETPLALGYGAGASPEDAQAAATREATQSLAFLWGEEIPQNEPPLGPTAGPHLEHLLWPGSHAGLLRWLDGGHVGSMAPMQRDPRGTRFVDLTPPWLGGGLRVAKAFDANALPLAFGASPTARALRPELRAHPIA